MVFTPGGRCSTFDTFSSSLSLDEEALKIVGAFKYLGVWLDSTTKFGRHLAVVEERARLASLETVKLAWKLEITDTKRFSILYRSLVESQLFGSELFPSSAVSVLKRVRRLFIAYLFELPIDTSSTLANFLLKLLPAELQLLKTRWLFSRRLMRHAVPGVQTTLQLEVALARRSVGWTHENFIIARQINPALGKANFSLSTFASELFTDFPDVDQLNFALLQKKAREDEALSFFGHMTSFYQAVMFRRQLGVLSFAQARLVLLFVSSGLRWRIARIPLKTCPFCPNRELLWDHFLECEYVLPFLSRDFIGMELLLQFVRNNRWRDVFTIVGDVLRIWSDALSTFALDMDVVISLANLP
jgi:hypothetical protein